jgi:hypothetical protein
MTVLDDKYVRNLAMLYDGLSIHSNTRAGRLVQRGCEASERCRPLMRSDSDDAPIYHRQ